MDVLDGRFYRWLEVFSNLLLNLLWLLACLPIVTVYPATAAMFGVVRDWVSKKEDNGLLRTFLRHLKENLKQSFMIGVLWTLFGAALLLDYYLVDQMPSGPRLVAGSLLFLVTLLYVFSSL